MGRSRKFICGICCLILLSIPSLVFAGAYSMRYNAQTGKGDWVMTDAPSDGNTYSRKDGGWAVPAGGAHDAVSLSTDLGNNLLGLSTQQLTLDNQTANYVFAGPTTGAAAAPTFRALVAGDIPDISATYQPKDADLTTYAGITPTANAQTLLGETFAQMQASMSIDDLITLSGVAEGSVNLATFTGSTISDNVTIKAALQALETAVETKDAVVTAGRSLTRSTNDIAADAELYSYRGSYGSLAPVATDDFTQVDYFKLPVTITEFRCYSDQTVVVQLMRDDGSAADMFTADVTCDSGGGSACASGCDTTLVAAEDNLAAGEKINLKTVSVSGTPTYVTMQWFGDCDD